MVSNCELFRIQRNTSIGITRQGRTCSLAEGWEFLDQSARYYLGISGEAFVRRWQAGEYPDPDGTPAMHVVMALPFAGVRP
jgi:hypothetical protein